jgi:hypothetical protein
MGEIPRIHRQRCYRCGRVIDTSARQNNPPYLELSRAGSPHTYYCCLWCWEAHADEVRQEFSVITDMAARPTMSFIYTALKKEWIKHGNTDNRDGLDDGDAE